jgi:hypothetical protein
LTAKGIGRKVEGQTCDIHGEAAKLVDLMENQLVSIAGLEGTEAVNHSGRVEGPQVVMKCPMQMANGTQRTTPALRAWKVTWKWLGKLLHHKPGSKEAEKVIGKILNHDHKIGKQVDDEQFVR